MYEAFYGFKEKPFSMLPDPGFLYLSKKHQAALTLLEYGLLNQVGFCVISGEAGSGKTTILRALLERVEDNVTVGLITNTHQSFGGLLDWVLSVFNLHRPNLTQVEMHQLFMEFLIEEYANGRTVLLIVDEAQNMKADALEELRMLSNVNSEKDQLMQVMLAGQPALKETLRLPDLKQFAQRIGVDYHLDVLSVLETCGYIQHRLTVAGAKKDIFTPAACERIHNYSGGTPRLINLLCETVLVYGFADQQDTIDVELVDEMVLERMKDSVVPIVNRDIAQQDNSQASKVLEKNFPWINPEGKVSQDGAATKKANADVKPAASEPVAKPAVKNVVVLETGKSSTDLPPTNKPVVASKQESKQQKTQPAAKPAVAEQLPVQAESPLATEDKKEKSGENRTVEPQKPVSKAVPVAAKSSTAKPSQTTSASKPNDTRKQLIKYGSIAAVLALLLVGAAIMLSDEAVNTTDVVKDTANNASNSADDNAALLLKREQEKNQLKQLRLEAETLKKERDAALAKAEVERQAKLDAEKLAAAKAAAATKAASETRILEEKKWLAATKERQRLARQTEAKAKEKARRTSLEASKLGEEKRAMQRRLDEQRRLKQREEARRMQLETQERQRQTLLAEEAQAKRLAAEEAAREAAAKPTECSGPTARFKSSCR